MQIDGKMIENIAYTIAVVCIGEIIQMVGRSSVTRIVERMHSNRAKTVGSLLRNTIKFVVWATLLSIVLSKWGVDIRPLLAGAGIVGIAIGFGAQSLVKDILSGLFMIAEDYINVGDTVEIAGKRGKVVSMKLRTIVVKDEEGGMAHIIPHSAVGVITKFSDKK